MKGKIKRIEWRGKKERYGDELDNTDIRGGSTDENEFIHAGLVVLGVTENLLTRVSESRKRSWQSSSKRARVKECRCR
jgi:hypothetical protein